jgi:hypothetical protein
VKVDEKTLDFVLKDQIKIISGTYYIFIVRAFNIVGLGEWCHELKA